jgi:gliding motility-associated-like protein
MQNPVKPGSRNPLLRLVGHGKCILSAFFILLFTAGFQFESKALPPGVPDMTNPLTKITVIQDNSRANNSDKNIVVAHVVDSDGNPVNGVTVYFTAGNVTIAVVTGGPFGAGNAQLDLASGVVGTVNISGTVNGESFINPSSRTVTFIAYQPSAAQSELQIVDDGAIADNTATNAVRAIVRDALGNPIPNQTVTFQITSGTATFNVSATGVTDANGQVTVTLVSGVTGPVTVTATVSGTPNVLINDSETVQFVDHSPVVNVPTTRIEIVDDGAFADGTVQNIVKAVITDAGGNPVANQTVTFALSNNGIGASFVGPLTGTTDANGEFFVYLVSNNPGTVNLTADVNGVNIPNGSPAASLFVNNQPAINNPLTQLIVVTTGSLANGTAQNSVRAHVVDASGNPVAGQTVTFVINSGTATPSALTVFTNANGDAILTMTSTVTGLVEVAASVNGVPMTAPNNSPVTVAFISDLPSVNVPTTRLEIVKGTAVADDVDLTTVRAVITDANGNPVAGQTVTFTLADGTAVFVGSTTLTTDANGIAIINLQSTTAGLVHITTTVNGTPITNGSPAEVQFIAGAPDLSNPDTQIIIDVNDADADGIAENVIRAHIVDAYGNPVAGQTVTFNYTGTATAGGPLTGTTDANGNFILRLTSTTVGIVSVTADVNGTPIPNGSPAAVRFTTFPDPNNPDTYIVMMTDNAFADNTATNSVRAHVVDNEGNPMAGALVTFTIASGEATIITPQPVMTDANGDAIIYLTSTKAGYVTVTAVADGKTIINGSPVRIRFTEENIWVPKVFTPNGDGTNDWVRPIVNGVFNLTYFNIYNRWGNLLFTTNNISQGWDGRFKGAMQPNETYMWIIVGTNSSNERVQKRGMISLVR